MAGRFSQIETDPSLSRCFCVIPVVAAWQLSDIRNFIAHTLLTSYPDKPEAIDESLAQLGECLRLKPGDPVPLRTFAKDFCETPKPAPALQRLRALMRPYAGRSQQGNYSAGLQQMNEVLRLHPHDAATHFVMGFAYLYSQRTGEAILRFREGLRYKPDDPEAHFGLASALSRQRKREDAVAEVREALRLRPDYPEARGLLRQLER